MVCGGGWKHGMRYYKQTEDEYILGIGTGNSGEEITETEYREIVTVIRNSPVREGYGYRLKTDLTWEEYEDPTPPPDPSEEVSGDEVLDALEGIL